MMIKGGKIRTEESEEEGEKDNKRRKSMMYGKRETVG